MEALHGWSFSVSASTAHCPYGSTSPIASINGYATKISVCVLGIHREIASTFASAPGYDPIASRSATLTNRRKLLPSRLMAQSSTWSASLLRVKAITCPSSEKDMLLASPVLLIRWAIPSVSCHSQILPSLMNLTSSGVFLGGRITGVALSRQTVGVDVGIDVGDLVAVGNAAVAVIIGVACSATAGVSGASAGVDAARSHADNSSPARSKTRKLTAVWFTCVMLKRDRARL